MSEYRETRLAWEALMAGHKKLIAKNAQLKARIAELEAAQKWRPMESAPRDEKVILKLPNRIEIARSRPLMNMTWVMGKLLEETPRYRWFYENGVQVTEEKLGWLPLPPLPEETK